MAIGMASIDFVCYRKAISRDSMDCVWYGMAIVRTPLTWFVTQ